MDAQKKQALQGAGVDVDGALERFGGNEALLERFLNKFPADPNRAALAHALETEDWDAALAASHSLKGVCGNLSFTQLHQLLTRQVAALRAADYAAARDLMPAIEQGCQRIVALL